MPRTLDWPFESTFKQKQAQNEQLKANFKENQPPTTKRFKRLTRLLKQPSHKIINLFNYRFTSSKHMETPHTNNSLVRHQCVVYSVEVNVTSILTLYHNQTKNLNKKIHVIKNTDCKKKNTTKTITCRHAVATETKMYLFLKIKQQTIQRHYTQPKTKLMTQFKLQFAQRYYIQPKKKSMTAI